VFDSTRLHEWAEWIMSDRPPPSNPHRIMTDQEIHEEWIRRLEDDLIDHDEIRRHLIENGIDIDDQLWDAAKPRTVIKGEVIESRTDRDRPTKGEIER
jgi:hypothetical protein